MISKCIKSVVRLLNICGIIVEYNPLHNGHLYHIEQIKKTCQCDLLIAIMSGNFVQRGEPSLINKHLKTQLALQAGVDIVIELPYFYAVGHADLFSYGAISLLNQCGVNEIIFGSELNDCHALKEIAQWIDNPLFNEYLKVLLNEGYSYPLACSKVLTKLTHHTNTIQSNDLLGIQYIRSILKINPTITFKTIKRIHTNYKDTKIDHDNIASATSIRNALQKNQDVSAYLPEYTYNSLKKAHLHYWDDYFPYLKYQIMSNQNLDTIHDINEGLENAIKDRIKEAKNFDFLVQTLISKRYTKGKIQRVLTHVLNQVTKNDITRFQQGPNYLRILGFKQDKSSIIQQIKKNTVHPIITNINKHNYPLLELDLRTSEIYHIVDDNKERKIPIII